MTAREDALRGLVSGDIFHAHFTHWPPTEGPSLICLVEAITDESILARTVSTQVQFSFDRTTGHSMSWKPSIYLPRNADPLVAVIDSIAPLPSRIYNGLLALDRLMRLGRFSDHPDKSRLTEEHREALLFVDKHYAENPL